MNKQCSYTNTQLLLTQLLGLFLLLSAQISLAECRDLEAIAAANKKAVSYFKQGEIFHPAVIQKNHHTSGKKEVASYVKVEGKRYSIFTLVDVDCSVSFRKRTRQWD